MWSGRLQFGLEDGLGELATSSFAHQYGLIIAEKRGNILSQQFFPFPSPSPFPTNIFLKQTYSENIAHACLLHY